MEMKKFIKKVMNLEKTKINKIEIEERNGETVTVVKAELHKKQRLKCPHCGKRCWKNRAKPVHKCWRGLDLGTMKCFVEMDYYYCECPMHGVTMESVPWAYPKSSFLKTFEHQVAYNSAVSTAKLVMENFRIHQDSVGRICKRVFENLGGKESNFDNLRKIGIDETSYKKGHKYLTVVINLETNQVIWLADGHGKSVLRNFFECLTEKQLKGIKFVTADGARYISELVDEYLPNAQRCIDTFHVVGWANEKLDEVRRRLISEAYGKDIKKN